MNTTLSTFARAYFHQDWDLDAENPDQVLREYRDESVPGRVEDLVAALRGLIESPMTEHELRQYWIHDVGAGYLPEYDDSTDLTLREWFEHVIDVLESSST